AASASLPHHRVHENRRIDANHVGTGLDEVAPPDALDVVLQLHAQRTIVPDRAGAAVDLARLKDEAASLRERNQHVHAREPAHRLASPATICPGIGDSRCTSRWNLVERVGWPIRRATCASSSAGSSASARPSDSTSASSQDTERSRSKAPIAAGEMAS